jgi:allantoate deiminase
MRERGIETKRPIEVVSWTDEEGTRFGVGMIGSRAAAGLLSPKELSREDEDRVTVAGAMREANLDPDRIGEARREPGSVHAYVELHIEQGRVLEQRGLPVGVVTGMAGPVWLRFVLRGEAGHAGATPMGSPRRPRRGGCRRRRRRAGG